ncbi:MAG: O-antigen ligase family protein [Candidatus Taylorbacteria bacterium]|nr:O-antigen ligase family protein [Candidatus Taylorbacteria bacterium]
MTIKKILRYIVIGGIFLIPFAVLIPIFGIGEMMIFPFITGKGFAFRALVEIIFVAWAVLAIVDKTYRPRFSWVFGCLSIFVLVMLLSAILGENPLKSIWSDFERMEGWLLLAHLWAYFVVMTSMFREEKWWYHLINTSFVVSFIMSIYAFCQLLGLAQFHSGGTRADATLGNSSYLGVYMLLHIFLALFMLFKQKGKIMMQSLYAVLAVIQFVVLIYTGTRGSYAALFGGIVLAALLVAIFDREKESARIRRGAIIILIILAAGLGTFYSIRNTDFVKNSNLLNRAASIFNTESYFSRSNIWAMAFNGFKERPVLGWGQEGFNYVFNKDYKPAMYGQEQWFDRAHNVFFDWLIAGGILGLLGYLSLYFVAIWAIWKGPGYHMKTVKKAIWTGMLAAYFIHNLAVFDHLASYMLFILILGYLHAKQGPKPIMWLEGNDAKKEKVADSDSAAYILPGAVLILIICLYSVVWKPLKANTSLMAALSSRSALESLTNFKLAISYDTAYQQEIREQMATLAPKITAGLKDKDAEDSKTYVKNQLELFVKASPNDARAYMFLGQYLSQLGDYAGAEKYLTDALRLSPAKQAFMFNLGQTYFTEGKKEEGYKMFKKAFEEEKSYDQARSLYVMAALYSGHGGEIYDVVKPILAGPSPEPKIIQFFGIDDTNKALLIKYCEQIKKEDPLNVGLRVLLSQAYLMNGNKDRALKELKDLKGEYPEYATDLDKYIDMVVKQK